MPSHLYVVCGDYRRAISANARALFDDELYVSKGRASPWYAILRLHNAASLVYAAMSCGSFDWSKRTCDLIKRLHQRSFIEAMPALLETFGSIIVHVYIRFGKFKELLDIPLPEDQVFYLGQTTLLRYGRAVAFAALGKVAEAEKEQAEFKAMLPKIPKEYMVFPNAAIDVFKTSEAIMDGEIEYRKGNYVEAFDHLREAIRRNDALVYGEPPGDYSPSFCLQKPFADAALAGMPMPVRHPYAALQLEQGDVEEALKTYADDLGYTDRIARASQHPNNVFSLHGYYECLTRLGRTEEAKIVWPQLKMALAVADVEIKSSCFCRLNTQDGLVNGHVNGAQEKDCCA